MTQPSQESLLDAEQTREPHPLQHHSVHDLRSIFAIGDLHGDADCGKFWVEKTGLVQHNEDNQWNWIGDDHSVLIFMGDYIDRGPQSREVLRMVKELTEAFPDRVVALLGNHEMHYLWDRTRYQDEFFQYPYSVVHPEEFFLWVNATRAEREEADSELLPPLFSALKVVYDSPRFMRMANMANIHHLVEKMTSNSTLANKLALRIREWQDAYVAGVAWGTDMGTWLQTRPLVTVAGDTLFVHAGISPFVLEKYSIKDLASLEQLSSLVQNAQTQNQTEQLLENEPGIISLLEYRMWHKKCQEVEDVLSRFAADGVRRLAVGHVAEYWPVARCKKRLLATDASLGRWFRQYDNYYCPSSNVSRNLMQSSDYCSVPLAEQCEGGILKLTRGAAVPTAAGAAGAGEWTHEFVIVGEPSERFPAPEEHEESTILLPPAEQQESAAPAPPPPPQ